MAARMPAPKNSQALQSLFFILEAFESHLILKDFLVHNASQHGKPHDVAWKASRCCLEQVPGDLNKASKNKSKTALPQEDKNLRKQEQFLPNLANDPC